MKTNQRGEEVQEETLWPGQLNVGELEEAVFMLLARLNLDLVRTNATKHGNVELELRAQSTPQPPAPPADHP